MNTYLPYEEDLSQYKARKKKRRIEAWDAKGGFTIWDSTAPSDYKAKAITDVSLAQALGVEVGPEITSCRDKKRTARCSPQSDGAEWITKRNKTTNSKQVTGKTQTWANT